MFLNQQIDNSRLQQTFLTLATVRCCSHILFLGEPPGLISPEVAYPLLCGNTPEILQRFCR